jgi:hypothetical protein
MRNLLFPPDFTFDGRGKPYHFMCAITERQVMAKYILVSTPFWGGRPTGLISLEAASASDNFEAALLVRFTHNGRTRYAAFRSAQTVPGRETTILKHRDCGKSHCSDSPERSDSAVIKSELSRGISYAETSVWTPLIVYSLIHDRECA